MLNTKSLAGVLIPITGLLLFGALLSYTHLLERLDRVVYDFLTGAITRPASENIIIIAIDEDSMMKYGQWPWSRTYHAQLIDKLSIGGAKVIGMDITMSEPSRYGSEDDQALAAAIRRSGKVILPVFAEWSNRASRLKLIKPIPVLSRAAAALAHVDFELDSDGILRRTYLKGGLGQPQYQAMAYEIVKLAGDFTYEHTPGIRNPHLATASSENWIRDYEVLIPFKGKPGHFSQISYADFMAPSFDPVYIKDKYILVGVISPGISDTLPTSVSGESTPMPGVEINANLLDALQTRLITVPLKTSSSVLLTCFLTIIPLLSFGFVSNRMVQIIISLSFAAVLLSTFSLLFFYQLWFPPTAALAVLFISYPIWTWNRLERLMNSLFKEKEKAAVTLHSVGDGVITTDIDFRVQYMNPAAEKITGYKISSSKRMLFSDLFPTITDDGKGSEEILFKLQAELFRNKLVRLQDDIHFADRKGQKHIVRVSAGPIKDHIGRIIGAVFGINDITEKEQALSQLTYEATHDHLTNLPNRSLLFDRVTHAIHRARRTGKFVTILFLDLDNFKKVNDQLGHSGGDRLLQMVSVRLKQISRNEDTVARLGGDEFVILLEDIADPPTAALVADKYIQHLTHPFTLDNHELYVTGSIGMSLFPKDGQDVETLMKNADIALYEAKKQGRNNAVFFSDEMNRIIQQRLLLESQLRFALNNSELQLHYQPQIRLQDNKIMGVEALCRWITHDKGTISPASFIPVAEESGLILPLSDWVLHTACQQVRNWQDLFGDSPRMSINISPKHFRDGDLPTQIKTIFHETGIRPENIDLELTEGLIMQDVKHSVDIMHSLKNLGSTVSIDDFGTGYSSLSYLKQFPLDTLKIDKSFIDEIHKNEKDEGLARSIITMGHGLGLVVVAEGVETSQQLEKLQKLNCDIIQGYYFSKPLPADQLTTLLEQAHLKNTQDKFTV